MLDRGARLPTGQIPLASASIHLFGVAQGERGERVWGVVIFRHSVRPRSSADILYLYRGPGHRVVQVRRASIANLPGTMTQFIAALTASAELPGPDYRPVPPNALFGPRPDENDAFLEQALRATDRTELATVPLPAARLGRELPRRARARYLLNERLSDNLVDYVDYDVEKDYGDEESSDERTTYTQINIVFVERLLVGNFFDPAFLAELQVSEPLSPFLLYAAERVLRRSPASGPGAYESTIEGGYYGDEVRAIHLETAARDALLASWLPLVLARAPGELVRASLFSQYGQVLPQWRRIANWRIELIEPALVSLPAQGRTADLDQEQVRRYRKQDAFGLPLGVAVRQGAGHYRLIDGRHRFVANQAWPRVRLIVGG